MEAAAVTLMPLVVISGFGAFILMVAWRRFGHVDHALPWAASFAALSAMWLIRLLAPAIPVPVLPGVAASSALGGAAVLLGTIGFRQRAHLPSWSGRLLAIYVVQMLATLALTRAGGRPPVLAVPAYLQDLVMLVVAVRTLVGRRRTERAVERAVQITVFVASGWIMLRLCDALVTGNTLFATLRPAINIAQPAAVMAACLAAIFMIAADLADRMRRLANTDRLTGLLNRRGFEEALAAVLASARTHGRTVALVVIDIDRFKAINDAHGHACGDVVLKGFASCLAANTARRDLVARIGGEEFAILLADVDVDAALCAAEVLRAKVADLRFGASRELAITASFGVAPLARQDASRADLLARADGALYQAKSMGRNRVTVAA